MRCCTAGQVVAKSTQSTAAPKVAIPEGFALVGAGSCKDRLGKVPQYSTQRHADEDQCAQQCVRVPSKRCVAYEYRMGRGSCTIYGNTLTSTDCAQFA